MSFANNFRRDLAGKVNRLSQYSTLDPVADKDFSPSKINERFIKMHDAVKTCFEAIADIASRDSSFLPSFFQGTVNPVYVKTHRYANKAAYYFVNGFNSNGSPTTFSDTRVVYSFPDLGDVSTQEFNCLLFKNGKLIPENKYILDNTAYGLKAFVVDSYIANNDKVTLAVHRVYNTTYKSWRKEITTNLTSLNEIFDIATYFPTFFSHDYLKLYVRKSGKVYFAPIPESKYTITSDSASGKIRLVASGISLSPGDTVIVGDSSVFFESSIISSYNSTTDVVSNPVYTSYGSVTSINLIHEIPSLIAGVNEKFPVCSSESRDFDVWLDGIRLLPNVHYFVSQPDPYLDEPAKLFINLDKSTGTLTNSNRQGTLYVMKNLPYIEGKTTIIQKELDTKGVELLNNQFLPAISNIGEIYCNGLFEDNTVCRSQNKDIYTFDVSNIKNFFFRVNAPVVQTTIDLVEESKTKYTEVDRMINLTGGNAAAVDRLKAARATITATANDITKNVVPSGGLTDLYDRYLNSLIPYILTYKLSNTSTENLLDSNSEETVLKKTINLDSNIQLNKTLIIDANSTQGSIEVLL